MFPILSKQIVIIIAVNKVSKVTFLSLTVTIVNKNIEASSIISLNELFALELWIIPIKASSGIILINGFSSFLTFSKIKYPASIKLRTNHYEW